MLSMRSIEDQLIKRKCKNYSEHKIINYNNIRCKNKQIVLFYTAFFLEVAILLIAAK